MTRGGQGRVMGVMLSRCAVFYFIFVARLLGALPGLSFVV